MTLKRRQVFQSSINESDSLFLFSKNFLFNSIFIKSEKLFPSLSKTTTPSTDSSCTKGLVQALVAL